MCIAFIVFFSRAICTSIALNHMRAVLQNWEESWLRIPHHTCITRVLQMFLRNVPLGIHPNVILILAGIDYFQAAYWYVNG